VNSFNVTEKYSLGSNNGNEHVPCFTHSALQKSLLSAGIVLFNDGQSFISWGSDLEI
jgi:hypothetical protein